MTFLNIIYLNIFQKERLYIFFGYGIGMISNSMVINIEKV